MSTAWPCVKKPYVYGEVSECWELCSFLNAALPTDISLGMSRTCETVMRHHVTGSARSEGYYFISSGEKQHYLTNTQSDSTDPPEDAQVRSEKAQNIKEIA